MNIYRTEFFAVCPMNGIRVKYALRIDTHHVVEVERINAAVQALPTSGLHEQLADMLSKQLPGHQVLTAHHHGVDIETRRPGVQHVAAGPLVRDESGPPGLYRTPGYCP